MYLKQFGLAFDQESFFNGTKVAYKNVILGAATFCVVLSVTRLNNFIGLLATFQSLWQQLICPILLHS